MFLWSFSKGINATAATLTKLRTGSSKCEFSGSVSPARTAVRDYAGGQIFHSRQGGSLPAAPFGKIH